MKTKSRCDSGSAFSFYSEQLIAVLRSGAPACAYRSDVLFTCLLGVHFVGGAFYFAHCSWIEMDQPPSGQYHLDSGWSFCCASALALSML